MIPRTISHSRVVGVLVLALVSVFAFAALAGPAFGVDPIPKIDLAPKSEEGLVVGVIGKPPEPLTVGLRRGHLEPMRLDGLDPRVDVVLVVSLSDLRALHQDQLSALSDFAVQGTPVVFIGSERELAPALGLPCVDSTDAQAGEVFAVRLTSSGIVRRAHFFPVPLLRAQEIHIDRESGEELMRREITIPTEAAFDSTAAWLILQDALVWAADPSKDTIDTQFRSQGEWDAIETNQWTWTGLHTDLVRTAVRVTVTANEFKIEDGYSNKDWYLVETRVHHELPVDVPYEEFCPFIPFTGGNTGWYVQDREMRVERNGSSSYNYLAAYGPTGTTCITNYTISIGGSIITDPAAGINASYSRTVSCPEITITDNSSLYNGHADWLEAFTCPRGDYSWCPFPTWPADNSKNSYYSWQAAIYRTTDLSQGVRLRLIPRAFVYLDELYAYVGWYDITRWTWPGGLGSDRTITMKHNEAPDRPHTPSGPTPVWVNQTVEFCTSGHDYEGDELDFKFDWGGGQEGTWGSECQQHSWSQTGTYGIRAKAKDSPHGAESNWSYTFNVQVRSCGNNVCDSNETPCTCSADCDGCCDDGDCGDCQYCSNHRCYDYDCCRDSQCGACQTCNTSTHTCQNIQCSGCNVCNNNHGCTDYTCCDNSDCSPCQTCQNHNCVPVQCGPCETCQNDTCVTDCSPCETCQGDTCVPVQCDPCESCQGGECVSTCGSCESCQGGSCVSGCGPCETCQNDTCVTDCAPCETCQGDTCVPVECGPCETCQGGECVSTCGSCESCQDGTCVFGCGPCETCQGDICVTDCGSCESCQGGTCVFGCGPCETCEGDICVTDCGLCEMCQDNTCVPVQCDPDACQQCNNNHGCEPIPDCGEGACCLPDGDGESCCCPDLFCFDGISPTECADNFCVYRDGVSCAGQPCPCDNFPEPCDWCWVGTPAENDCPAEWCGTDDGCDCGCQFVDPDCGGGGACNGQVTSTSVKTGKLVFGRAAPLTSRVAEGMCIDDTTEGECNGQGGDFLGPGTGCTPGICKEPCTTDADCDDGLFCNGMERCDNGSCQPGTPPCPDQECCDEEDDVCGPGPACTTDDECDDGNQCTMDRCVNGCCQTIPCTIDADCDGDVDLDDYRLFHEWGCLTTPCGSALCDPPLYADECCAYADLDADGDVDLVDFAAFQVAFTGRGDPEYSPEYSNEIDPITSYFASGAGASVADDMTLAGTARELVYYDLLVYGGGGGPFDVTASLYNDCPGNGGTLIPGTTGTWVDIPDDGLYLLGRELAPVTIPSEVWMVATFSTPESGWMIAGDAETGFTGDIFGANDPPWVCNYWFGGDPYAGFWANLECVDDSALLLRDEGTLLVPIRIRTQEPVAPVLDALHGAQRKHKPGS